MKKTTLLFTSLLLLLFATYSCEKDELEPIAITNKSLEVAKNANPAFLEHDMSKYKIKTIWKSAIVYNSSSANKKSKSNEAVEVNFTQDNKTAIPLSKNGKIRGRQRLLLTFEKGEVRETIIEYIPSDSFMGDIKEINSGNFKSKQFDGEITFKNIKEDSKIVWYLSKGDVVKKARRTAKKIKYNKTTTTSRWIPQFTCTGYIICVGDGAEAYCEDRTSCEWEYFWEEDPEGIPVDDPYDCAVNSSWPWCQNGGGGGGEEPPADTPTVWYYDNDSDGWHSLITTAVTSPGNNWKKTTAGEDCNDADPKFTSKCCPVRHLLINDVCTDLCDLVRAAADVYKTTGGIKEQNYASNSNFNNSNRNGWTLDNPAGLNLPAPTLGFNSAVYGRDTNGDGQNDQYMMVFEGTTQLIDTNTSSFDVDWDQNWKQAMFGTAEQYRQARDNAITFQNFLEANGYTGMFVGHSLGGGLAATASMTTGLPAFTYNAAGVSQDTKDILHLGTDNNIQATIVDGEMLDMLQKTIGLHANGNVTKLNGEDRLWVQFFEALIGPSGGLIKGYTAYKRHLMDAILARTNCN